MHENVGILLQILVFAIGASGFVCLVFALFYSYKLGTIAKKILLPFFITPFVLTDASLSEEGIAVKRNARMYYLRFLVLLLVSALSLYLGLRSMENLNRAFEEGNGEIHLRRD